MLPSRTSWLVLLLAAITTYYAWHGKRQADASSQQVAASKRQADIAQQTLDLLLRQTEQQRQIDLSTVSFNLEAARSPSDSGRCPRGKTMRRCEPSFLTPHMGETKFARWTVKGAQLPLSWDDALHR